VPRSFPRSIPNGTVPNKTTIYRSITKFEETGSVCDRQHNRRPTVLNDDTLEEVRLGLLFCFIVVVLRSATSVAF
jgi:hypothetical protein